MRDRSRFASLGRRLVVPIVLGSMWLVGCSTPDSETSETTTSPTTLAVDATSVSDGQLVLGLLIPTTGEGEAIGNSIRRAVEDEVEVINADGGVGGKPVQLEIADEDNDGGLPQLLSQDVDAIVGPTSSLVALRQLPTTFNIPNPVPTCSPAASALALDDFDDGNWFFRTIPSDSLQVNAIAAQAEQSGALSVSLAYVDDPYGRGLAKEMEQQLDSLGLGVNVSVGIANDEGDLSDAVSELLANSPRTVVILANETLGGRLLRAIDVAIADGQLEGSLPPRVLINDAVSTARQPISELSEPVRAELRAVAPRVVFGDDGEFPAFAAQAADCVDLFALAAIQADSDAPAEIRRNVGSISSAGITCDNFKRCADQLGNNLSIDFQGRSGPLDLDSSGDPTEGLFQIIQFNGDGTVDKASTTRANSG